MFGMKKKIKQGDTNRRDITTASIEYREPAPDMIQHHRLFGQSSTQAQVSIGWWQPTNRGPVRHSDPLSKITSHMQESRVTGRDRVRS